MIRYICDLCRREIDPAREVCFHVQIQVYAASEPTTEDEPDDRDHLQEIQDLLETLNQMGDEAYESAQQSLRFDLCPQCRRKFLRDPLQRDTAKLFGFSKN